MAPKVSPTVTKWKSLVPFSKDSKILQRTLSKPVELRGIGLHSGKEVTLTLRPAAPSTGIIFVRTDLQGSPEIPAQFQNVVSTQMATSLGIGNITVSTVEHLLAALQGLGIDNVRVEVNAPEIPILDGSAVRFCEAIGPSLLQNQDVYRPILCLRRKVEVKVGEKWAYAEPSAHLEIQSTVDFDHPSIGYQEYHFIQGTTPFSEIASARTFGFLREVEALKKMGLARGGSLENAVVLDDAQILNPEGLRYPNEFVRHKVLDALGDLKLAGIELRAMIRLHRAGHELHRKLLDAIFESPDHYEIIDPSPSSAKDGRSEKSESWLPSTARGAVARASLAYS